MKTLTKYALALILLAPTLSVANVLPLDGSWQGPFDEFIGGAGNFFTESWTFTGPAELRITDEYYTGDMYTIYDNGVSLGNSSTVSTTPQDFNSNPATAWTDSNFSHFDDILGAGSHDITIQAIQLPNGYADSTYSISALPASVPDSSPGLIGVLAIGSVLALGARARRLARPTIS